MSETLSSCGCFPELPVRASVWNRPGLASLDYRAARWAGVLERLLSGIDRPEDARHAAALSALRTREPDDPALGLLDAFAVVADVLGFYSERIANEGFLDTATERRSVHELARLIGYEPAPGVAAAVWLTFNVDDRLPPAPGSALPPSATVPAGTRVQSVPVQDQLPQTFETSTELIARAERNEMRPRLTIGVAPDPGADRIYLEGIATGLGPGDVVVIHAETDTQAKRVQRVVADEERNRSRVDFVSEPAELFEPFPAIGVLGVASATKTSFTAEADSVLNQTWSGSALQAHLYAQGWPVAELLAHAGYSAESPEQGPAEPGVYALRSQGNVFGHNAPKWNSALEGWAHDWTTNGALDRITTSNSQADTPTTYDNAVDLDPVNPRILPDSWVALEDGTGDLTPYRVNSDSDSVSSHSRNDFAISAKVTKIELTAPSGAPVDDLDDFGIRETTVHAESERLELAEVSLPETLDAAAGQLMLDGLVLELEAGQPIALAGEDAELGGVRWNEVVTLTGVTHAAGYTTLHFGRLEHSYRRATLTLNANVTEATHGESVGEEILGSASGAPGQVFTLAKPPLTHVQSASSDGAESTLEVLVDGGRWQQARGLYGAGPRDERYVVRREDDGRTRVIFGDGERGARPPSGTDNVRARYRSGIGAAGMVAQGSLTLLQTRPLGIRDVVNPLAASGAADPEDRDSARSNAPLTVLTMGRVVTLSDYEDFARGFAGIAKAKATEIWRGDRRTVHVTVVAPGGEPPSDETRANLGGALRGAGDPGVSVTVDAAQVILFTIAGAVLTDPRHEAETVRSQIATALADRYGFERRRLGEPVIGSQILAAALAVDGVVDFRLTALRPLIGPAGETAVIDPLPAHAARPTGAGDQAIAPAELLVLTPLGAEITEASS